MTDDQRQDITTDDVAAPGGADRGAGGDKAPPAAGAEPGKGADQKPAADAARQAKTIVAGADSEEEEKAKEAEAKPKSYWPDDWREKLAEHIAAGDQKVYKKELARLQRITDPAGIYGNWRELEAKFTSGGLVKIPGKDAKEEEIKAFHKALGVPEKPEDYIKEIQLENGAVIGEADKPILDSFLTAAHEAGAPPAVVNRLANWYYKEQEERAAALDEADEKFRIESERALKEEWGPAFKRNTNALASLFATAPGGADVNNPNALFARLMGARMGDGRIVGNDPDMIRWLHSLRMEINPAASVVEEGSPTALSLDQEIEKIEKIMRTDRREYNRKYADRYAELLAAREKIQARSRA